MRASELLLKRPPLATRAIPSLTALARSVERIAARWPDVVVIPSERDREMLAREMLARVQDWNWSDIKMSRVMSAAMAVFDDDRRERPDLDVVRKFYLDETAETQSKTFLAGMVKVYIDTFDPASHLTLTLARALALRSEHLDARTSGILRSIPELFAPSHAPRAFAATMFESSAPFASVKSIGIRAPHGIGLMRFAHREFIRLIAPDLIDLSARDKLFAWLDPPGSAALQTEAGMAIEALVRPWSEKVAPDEVRSEIIERIVSVYGDPRTQKGGIWSGFDSALKAVLLRWLTKQDMRFFCDMVDATQPSHMWPPRRDFWLRLYEDGRIDEAWVAFGASARDFARRNLLRSGATDVNKRFGRQHDRGGSTSLLIMRIGSKIVVDGCHSYRTHIFRRDDPNAPKLYGSNYYCDDIMRQSKSSKPHNSIPSWADWVMRNV